MIVMDTNIMVAALWSRTGASHHLLKAALSGQIDCAVSVALALEYEAVLQRATLRDAGWASMEEVETILDALFSICLRIPRIVQRIRPTLPDPTDEMVLECALEARASTIVTMNLRDFANIDDEFGIAAMRPGDFLAKIRSSGVAI